VSASEGGAKLSVTAQFPSGTDASLAVVKGATPFVENVRVADGERWTSVGRDGDRWIAPACTRGCTVSYDVQLERAARAEDDRSLAEAHHDAIEAPPSTWLLRPLGGAGTPMRFHVVSPPGNTFVAGVFPVAGAEDTYQALATDWFGLPYAAFGRIERIDHVTSWTDAAILGGAADAPKLARWVKRASDAIVGFYGQPPIPRVLVLVRRTERSGVGFGSTMGSSGAAIDIAVGTRATDETLANDWVLVHEMSHTALPDLPPMLHWLEEGLATYVEPLARASAKLVTPERVWKDWLWGMPLGLPEEGDEGLNRTRTWGRTFWGGALFCLQADVTIREGTSNRRSLRDALREIVRQGGNIGVTWPIERILDVGDSATGLHVLRETYDRMALAPGRVDLDALFAKLGVRSVEGHVTFDDSAPLAAVRRSMMEP
jgi:predicted metalloprotease with PDZ domain